jgi:hypothetical protein
MWLLTWTNFSQSKAQLVSDKRSKCEKLIGTEDRCKTMTILWWPCLLMDQNEMINLYKEPSIYASYQVSVHLAKQFQRRRFLSNQLVRNKNCLW